MTPGGYHRRKDPEGTRAAILAEAGALAVRIGAQALTVQAVAEAAGVTKGGLLHHFASKEALLRALQADAIAGIEAAVDRHIAGDPVARGRFTRAYIRASLEPPQDDPCPGLIAALWADPGLRRDWHDWMAAQEARHAETDGEAALALLRFASDGIWMAMIDGIDTSALLPELIAATRR